MKGILYNSDCVTQIWGMDLGNKNAGDSLYKKFAIQNDTVLAAGLITGSLTQWDKNGAIDMFRWGICPDTLSCPYNVSIELLNGGDLTPDTRYYYRITAFNELGETGGSLEVWALTDSTKKSIKLTWDELPNAAGYCIYRSTNQDYTNARRDVIENPSITEWIDTGQASDPSSPYGWPGINTDFDLPSENTTAGEAPDYGTPPAGMTADDIILGNIKIGEQKIFWIEVSPALATSSAGNPRNCIIDFSES